jgi:hypothetical protein
LPHFKIPVVSTGCGMRCVESFCSATTELRTVDVCINNVIQNFGFTKLLSFHSDFHILYFKLSDMDTQEARTFVCEGNNESTKTEGVLKQGSKANI